MSERFSMRQGAARVKKKKREKIRASHTIIPVTVNVSQSALIKGD